MPWKYSGRVIKVGQSWTDNYDIKHPYNWNSWSADEKAAKGLIWEDDPKPQWFPWNSSFRSVEVIHRYFEDNQMRRFIPTEFTWGKDHPEYIPPKRSRKQ